MNPVNKKLEEASSRLFLTVLVMLCYYLQVKTVETIGRRSLMLVGFGGMFVFYALMTISFRYEVR